MKKLYLISGLGADYRMFEHLYVDGFENHHIEWLKPEDNEALEHYAGRLSTLITDEEPVLIGLSFGGMVASEIHKHKPLHKIIYISSAQTKNDLPFYFPLAGKANLHKVLPLQTLGQSSHMMNFLIGAKTTGEKKLLASIIRDTDPHFYTWAIEEILHWKNIEIPSTAIHLHGTTDLVLPYPFIKNVDFTLKNGGHMMVYNRATEINSILSKILN